ncbi:MAG: flavodoxin [Enterococcaceae bacterium]|jgi:flavodoxin short chain|nr:flavodoxin [Enterococcaceae bacterium]MCI1920235.1 flavodoxin [Enterococcaceae bacterium]
MALAKIVYASMTGNTEAIAELLEADFKEKGLEVVCEEVDDVDADYFDDADACIVATYTYNDGELPFDFEDFHDELEDKDLSGKVYAVVGSGDSELYPDYFCHAAIDFDEVLAKTGAKKAADVLKVENDPDDDDEKAIAELVDKVVNALG